MTKTTAPRYFPCGCCYMKQNPSGRAVKSQDWVRVAGCAIVCRCGTVWSLGWTKNGSVKSQDSSKEAR